jgi:hypothetical protein
MDSPTMQIELSGKAGLEPALNYWWRTGSSSAQGCEEVPMAGLRLGKGPYYQA